MFIGSEKRVLLAIDDARLREELASALRERRVEVIEARADSSAASIVSRQHPAVVIVSSADESPAAFSLISGVAREEKTITLLVTNLQSEQLEPFAGQIHGITSKAANVDELSILVQMCCDIRARRNLELMSIAILAGALMQW